MTASKATLKTSFNQMKSKALEAAATCETAQLIASHNLAAKIVDWSTVQRFVSHNAGLTRLTSMLKPEYDEDGRATLAVALALNVVVDEELRTVLETGTLYTKHHPAKEAATAASGASPSNKPARAAAVPGSATPRATAANLNSTTAESVATLVAQLKDKDCSVAELEAATGWVANKVRNTIDSARRAKHDIKSVGKGVFSLKVALDA